MYYFKTLLHTLVLSATLTDAYPQLSGLLDGLDLGTLVLNAVQALDDSSAAAGDPPFDATAQYVSNTGSHAYQAPGPGDIRGPCPGLNVMANHGYLPRNGYATIPEFIAGTRDVFGMGVDLSTVLAAYGGALDGAVASWSIGGDPHIGIGGSHNNYETDSSPLRGDLNQYGSNTNLVVSQFEELFNLQPDASTANYNIDVLKAFRGTRFNESIAKNPYFTYAPFSGAVVSQAAFVFIYRFMGNKSAENPAGVLNQDVLKSFMGVSGSSGSFTWTPGTERIPDNWYRRANTDLYGFKGLSADIGTVTQGQEYVGQAGCNQGTVNSYTPINVSNTGGSTTNPLFSPLCEGFAYANLEIVDNIPVAGLVVQELLLPIQNALGCITAPSVSLSAMQACPGYGLYGGPTGQVVPGAIQ